MVAEGRGGGSRVITPSPQAGQGDAQIMAAATFLSPVGRDSFFRARDALASQLAAASAAVSAAGGTGAPPAREDLV